MSFNRTRSIRTTREIGRLPGVEVRWHYSDKRAGNKNRHKIGIAIEYNSEETAQMIQSIIKKNFPESFPQKYRGRFEAFRSPTFVEIVWISEEVFTNEIFKIVTEDEGYSIKSVAG